MPQIPALMHQHPWQLLQDTCNDACQQLANQPAATQLLPQLMWDAQVQQGLCGKGCTCRLRRCMEASDSLLLASLAFCGSQRRGCIQQAGGAAAEVRQAGVVQLWTSHVERQQAWRWGVLLQRTGNA
jgi:hypothetical protein